MNASEMRSMTDAELANLLDDSHQELFNMRFQRASGKLTNTSRVKHVRRQIARLNTILRERELAAEAE